MFKTTVNAGYNEEGHAVEWPWWKVQNDSLGKIMFGRYKGSTLPIPFVNAIRKIKDDAYRSFFTKRCIVYHNALFASSPPARMDQHGAHVLDENDALLHPTPPNGREPASARTVIGKATQRQASPTEIYAGRAMQTSTTFNFACAEVGPPGPGRRP